MGGRSALRSSARLNGSGAAAQAAGGQAAAGQAPRARAAGSAGPSAAASRRARAAERAREVEDSPRVLREKCRRLARVLRNAKHLVVYTGAGISTAACIPDYRGPAGVWTRLRRGERVGRVELAAARPTFTHMALTALWARGALKFVVSQNCDGLHLRAGLPRRALAELHGDMFCELCAACRRVYLRAFDVTERTARHRHGTRRLCHGCGGELRDSIVHFGERGRAAWPLNWAGALRHARRADVVLCLGSSLKVLRRYPRLWRMQRAPPDRPALYIVNLQWTPKDSVAALKINARCDAVMAQVARRLRLRVPRYRAADDPLLAHAEPLAPPEAHTTRRPLLRAPELEPSSSDPDDLSEPSASSAPSASSTSSASDTDEELPLRRLADRLRRPSPLCSFQVNMHDGEATILLRTEHSRAPSPSGSPPAARPPPAPHPPWTALPPPWDTPPPPWAAPAVSPSPSATAELRRVRIARPFRPAPAPLNGNVYPKSEEEKEHFGLGSKLRRLLEYDPRIEPTDRRKNGASVASGLSPKDECEDKGKVEPRSDGEGSASSLAAAIIRRTVLVCRGSLYPGLHTILAGELAGEPARAGCAWCARRHAARRCLWYGPPRCTPLAARAWRRVRARRLLCACCPAPPQPAPPAPPDDTGWYGKGYRKGRRKRR